MFFKKFYFNLFRDIPQQVAYGLMLVFILVLSYYIFSLNLVYPTIDVDELFTINILSQHNLSDIITKGNIQDVHPPLYHFLLYIFVSLFGVSELTIKIPSIIFSMFSVLGIYILAAKVYNRNAAIVSTLVMLSIPEFIFISQRARGYALLLCLSIYTMIFMVNIINNKSTRLSTILYIIFSTLLIYTHYYGLLLLFVELLFPLFLFNKNLTKRILIIATIIFVLYLPWIKYVPISNISSVDYGKYTLFRFFEWIVFGELSNKYNLIYVCLFFISIIFILYDIIVQKYKKKIIENLFLVWVLFLPCIIIGFLYYICNFKIYKPNYLILLAAPGYILIAKGIFCLINKEKLAMLIMVTFIFFNMFNYTFTCAQNNILSSGNPKEVFLFVKNNFYKYDHDTDLLIGFRDFSFEYYISKFNENTIPVDRIHPVNEHNIIDCIRNNKIVSFWLIDDKDCQEYNLINKYYKLEEKVRFYDGQDSKKWIVFCIKITEENTNSGSK